jgi:hypothetical protein
MGNAGGCEVLLQVYEDYKNNDLVCEVALRAIRNLAVNAENKARIVNAGGMHLLNTVSCCILC